ncbi:threonylcarbamoyladenosine tRNA methylthiotransferase-like [Saccoglossus kowalevskii]|uniref:tRNA-t(6)A37 methylthiotransferase n=1 Tax=Saccoglossus kowalevskii TaxID=10224 RepID=A0ABM0GWK9_SACKO|nr:PREDICTED: threonylcarbamoyladenosine tRNA methylthiotransferase-like [Saccoglossus kowalevskii]
MSAQEIDDIEDAITPERRLEKKHIVPRAKKFKNHIKEEKPNTDSVIPGCQSVYVKTWGCSHNNSDSEYMAGQLASYGYKITETEEAADLWLLNSCTVKTPAEQHFQNSIIKAREQNKYMVLAGCVPQAQPKLDYINGVSVVGVQQIDRIVEVVEETFKGHTVRLFGQKKKDGKKIGGAPLNLPKIRKNPLIEIIAINTGCLNACTYCKTKYARGELGSYQPSELVARAKQSFEEGVCELWLTSEDTGAYGKDIGVTIVELLWQLVEVIPDGCMMRIGMTNPPYILEHLEEISKILKHPRVYSFLHVPVQSGSDSVLMDMKREYCVDDFKHVCNFLKKRVPGVTIATDIICGFPTETDEDFDETMQLVEEYKFPSLFINQYFPRPGTPSAKMTRVPTREVKKRTKKLSQLFQDYRPYDHKVGEEQHVLVTEDSHDGRFYVAHNKFYDQVLVPKEENLLGKMIKVKITSTGKHYLIGDILKDEETVTPSIAVPLPKGCVSGANQQIATGEHSSRVPRYWLTVAVCVAAIAVIADILKIIYQYMINR